MDLTPVAGFLPKGINGAMVAYQPIIDELPAQKCDPRNRTSVTFYSYNDHLHDSIAAFFRSQQDHLPFPVKVEKRSLEETINASFHNTMLSLVGADALEAKADQFFNGFNSDKNFSFAPIPDLAENLRKAALTTDPIMVTKFVENAHRALLKSGYVIPLGQLVVTQRYPSFITNIQMGDRVNGFPKVSLMEAK